MPSPRSLMYKLIKLLSFSIIGASVASGGHYLLSSVSADSLKALAYGSIFVFVIMGVVLDDVFSAYFKSDNSTLAIISTVTTFIFISGSFRAFTLKEPIEGLILAIGIGLFWSILMAIYVKLLINKFKQQKQQQEAQW